MIICLLVVFLYRFLYFSANFAVMFDEIKFVVYIGLLYIFVVISPGF